MNKQQLFKNFRFWILVAGVIFIAVGFVIKKFGTPPCSWESIEICADLTWILGALIFGLGLLLTFLGIILLFAEFISRLLTKKKKISSLNIESMKNQQSNSNQQNSPVKINWKYILITVLLVVVFAGGIFSWQLWRALQKEIKILKQEQERLLAGWKTYSSQELGIAFSYPDFWGEVKTNRTQGPTECAFGYRIVNGTEISLRFSNNFETNLYFTSPDYKSALCLLNSKGGSEEIVFGFTRICESDYPSDLSKVFGCKSINIAGSQSVSFYTTDQSTQSCGYSSDKHIKFYSPSKNFSGVNIITSLPIGYDSGCEKTGKPDMTLEEFRDWRGEQLKNNQLFFEDEQFLWGFDNFIKTIKFI